MPKRSKVEACFICEEMPCVCGKVKARPVPHERALKAPVETITLDAASARFFGTKEAERDLSLVNALQVLLPDLHPASRKEAEDVIRPSLDQDLDRRLTEWRRSRDSTT